MKQLLRNRVFRIMLSSDLLDQCSIWIRNMAILYFIIEKTNQNPIAVSLISVIEFAPIFIFSFIGGTFADRWNPKKTIIGGGLLSIASILIIIACVTTGLWQALFFATFVSAIVSQFSQPSTSKVFKRHIEEEHVGSAIAVSQSMSSLFVIIGPIVGTFIYTQFGILTALYIVVITFGLSTFITLFLPKGASSNTAGDSSVLADMKSGFRYVWQNQNLKMICAVFGLIGLAGGLVQPLEVFIVTDRLDLPKEAIQWLTALTGTGILVGSIFAAILSERLNGKLSFIVALLFMSIGTVVEVLSTSFWLTASMVFFTAILLAFAQVYLSTIMIKQVDEPFIGRTSGVITPIMMGALLIGTSISGIFLQKTSLFTVYGVSAVFILLAVIPATRLIYTRAANPESNDKVENAV